MTSAKRVIQAATRARSEDLDFLGELIEQGRLRTVIDRTYPLEKVPEAHRYVETGQKKGNIIITVHEKEETA